MILEDIGTKAQKTHTTNKKCVYQLSHTNRLKLDINVPRSHGCISNEYWRYVSSKSHGKS